MIISDTELKSMLDAQSEQIGEFIKAARLTNTLLLAQLMRLDPTVPESAEKLKRYVGHVETTLGDDNG